MTEVEHLQEMVRLLEHPDYKWCGSCDRALPVNHFGKHRSHKDGLSSYCKKCEAQRQKQHREGHTPKRKRRQRPDLRLLYLTGQKNDLKRHQLVDFKKKFKEGKTSCEHCGFVAEHPAQLEIDHKDGDKFNNDSSNLQILCANCHRLKTVTEREAARRYTADQRAACPR